MISTRTHGALDYLSAAALLSAAQLHGRRSTVGQSLAVAGLATVAYSLITRYEWGVVGALPMQKHLALDALQGVAFCATALLLNSETRELRHALAGYGLFAIVVAALTQREPEVTWSDAR